MARYLITGAGGQDGLIAMKILTNMGQDCLGLLRNKAALVQATQLLPKARFGLVDVTNLDAISSAVKSEKPDYLIHLAGSSSVAESWTDPVGTIHSNTLGTLGVLESVRRFSPDTKVLIATSSEMYPRKSVGISVESEKSPSSPYGVAKLATVNLLELYRSVYSLRASTAILFNHESPLRPRQFVSQRISNQVWEMKSGERRSLVLENPKISKDFSWAPDVVRAMLSQVQNENEDRVFGSGSLTSLVDLAKHAAAAVELEHFSISSESRSERPNEGMHPFAKMTFELNLWGRLRKHPEEWMGLMVKGISSRKDDSLWFVDA